MSSASSVLMTIPLVATILISLTRGLRHLDSGWPAHANHHLVHQVVLAVALAGLSLCLVWGACRRGERWAWWFLLVAGVALYGGYWVGNLTVGLGEPGIVPNTSQAVQIALYTAGLVLARRRIRDPGVP